MELKIITEFKTSLNLKGIIFIILGSNSVPSFIVIIILSGKLSKDYKILSPAKKLITLD